MRKTRPPKAHAEPWTSPPSTPSSSSSEGLGPLEASTPTPEYVQQLDDYLAQSASQGRVRMGILTDGKHWLLRWPNAGPVRMSPPHTFTLAARPRNTIGEWLGV